MSLVIKRLPTDFRVEELTQRGPTGGGYGLYRLTKTSIGTPEAIELIVRNWKLQRHQVGYGGLKDKHATTVQHLTIRGGPARGMEQQSFELDYLGQTDRPFTSGDIAANRFDLLLRNLTADARDAIAAAFVEAARDGVPNYFDDQRFGSLGRSGEFIAAAWCREDYERAVWLALADSNEHDDGDEGREKELLRTHWGDWTTVKAKLARSHRRSVITYLVDHPTGFRRALGLIRQDLRGLYLSALQSALWNDMLAIQIRESCPAERLREVRLACGSFPFATALEPDRRDELLALRMPLPSARAKLPPGKLAEWAEAAAAKHGLSLGQMRIRHPKDSFFSRGERAAWVLPAKAESAAGEDEVYPSRRTLRLAFDLPRGSYATIVVKRVSP